MSVIIFLLGALAVYALLNYYAGRKIWTLIHTKIRIKSKLVYILVIIFFSLSFILSQFLPQNTWGLLKSVLSRIGGGWLVFILYFLLASFVIDICRLIFRRKMSSKIYYRLLTGAFAVAVFFLIWGSWNATHPQTVHYSADIPARIVVVSDIHIGQMVDKNKLADMVDRINQNKPDFVFFAGDTFDRSLQLYNRENMAEVLKGIRSKYGTYAIFGNHEYYYDTAADIIKGFEAGGVTVLRDQTVTAGGLNIIGRDDISVERSGAKRKSLEELMKGIDPKYPVVVLDHQPGALQEMRDHNIALGISGHTHGGQLFPLNLISGAMYEQSKGIETEGKTTTIVSTGYGLWGPVYRIGTRSQMIVIN